MVEKFRELDSSSLDALPKLTGEENKYSFGHVLLVGGNMGMPGAIRLAGEACLRSGAGLVTICTHPDNYEIVSSHHPEFMVRPIKNPKDLTEIVKGKDSIVIGPGLGRDSWAKSLLKVVLNISDIPVVYDADALNILSSQKHSKIQNSLVTPHLKEASRLLGLDLEEVKIDPEGALEDLLKSFNSAILKSPNTILSDGAEYFQCSKSNPILATGGTGDILAGLCGSFLAQGLSLIDAAKLAVYTHSQAALRLGQETGLERGHIASDLFQYIRKILG